MLSIQNILHISDSVVSNWLERRNKSWSSSCNIGKVSLGYCDMRQFKLSRVTSRSLATLTEFGIL